jgi:hypothetical protein
MKFTSTAQSSERDCPSAQRRLASLVMGVCFLSSTASAQVALNACDLTGDGAVNAADVALAVNMALGLSSCTANIVGAGVCNVVVVQRVLNAALSGACVPGFAHAVSLNWNDSISSNVAGYNLYRGSTSGGPYTILNVSPIAVTNYTDSAVQAGQAYYYVATAVDGVGNESAYSAEASASVPFP